ncbi:MAG: hypothetical protein AMXMBFR44_0310 [Candidatus Campbellbacteria bacterium]
MATKNIGSKTMTLLKGLFVPRTNTGVWIRLLFLFFLVCAGVITLSLLFFFKVRGIGDRVITSSLDIPEAREVDKEHIQKVLGAFSVREATFFRRLQEGVTIPDPY